MHIWQWYFEISQFFTRIKDDRCHPIAPSEFVAWRDLTQNEIHDYEFEMLINMDRAYCRTMNIELRDFNIREKERQRIEHEQKSRKR